MIIHVEHLKYGRSNQFAATAENTRRLWAANRLTTAEGDKGGQQHVEFLPRADEDERGHGKDNARSQGFSC